MRMILALIISATMLALGTSAPELAVSTSAAIHGSNEIAVSNVLGSNIFNILVVLGTCAIIRPIPVEKKVIKRDIPFSIIITALLFFTACGGTLVGISSVIHSIPLTAESVIDLFVLIGISILTLIFSVSGRRINRIEGAVMVLSYTAYIAFAAIR